MKLKKNIYFTEKPYNEEDFFKFFNIIHSEKKVNNKELITCFRRSYKYNSLLTTKFVFYIRDCRNGFGKREIFRTLIHYMANYMPEAVIANIKLIPFFGRYDDWYSLMDTKMEKTMWSLMAKRFKKDMKHYVNNEYDDISYLAKWIKTPDASSETTRKLGIKTALSMDYKVKPFKKNLKLLRKALNINEIKMSLNNWDNIDYDSLSNIALDKYKDAFMRHDKERFSDYLANRKRRTNYKGIIDKTTIIDILNDERYEKIVVKKKKVKK